MAAFSGLALVVLLLALRKADLDLDAAALEIQMGPRAGGGVAGPFDLSDEFADLSALQEQFAGENGSGLTCDEAAAAA